VGGGFGGGGVSLLGGWLGGSVAGWWGGFVWAVLGCWRERRVGSWVSVLCGVHCLAGGRAGERDCGGGNVVGVLEW